MTPVPEIIDPVFAKTSQNARFLLSENERFGLVFVKTGSINSGTVPEFIDPRFRENKPKTLVFSHRQRAYWACFRENRVYNLRHSRILGGPGTTDS